MSRSIRPGLLACWLLVASGHALADECIDYSDTRRWIDYSDYIHWVDAFDYQVSSRDLEVVGDRLYILDPHEDIRILELVDGRPTAVLGTVPTGHSTYGMDVVGDILFAGNWDDGLVIYNVAIPFHPYQIASVAMSPAGPLRVVDGIAYICSSINGLRLVDVSDPWSPVYRATVAVGHAMHVAVHGSIAYVATGNSQMQIVDCANPSSPVIIGQCEVPDSVGAMAVEKSLLFVVGQYNGPDVFDLTDPTDPVLLTHITLPRHCFDIDVVGSRVCVPIQSRGVAVIDASDRHDIRLVSIIATRIQTEAVAISGDQVLVGNDFGPFSGIDVVDISSMQVAPELGNVGMPEYPQAIHARGSLAFVANSSAGLTIVDVSDPNLPVVVGQADTPGRPGEVDAPAEIAWLACWEDGLEAVKVSDPTEPIYLGRVDIPDLAVDVKAMGEVVVVASQNEGVAIVDGRDPANPTLILVHQLPGPVAGLDVDGQFVFVAVAEAGLAVLDLRDPTSPVQVGGITGVGWNIQDVAIVDGLAVLADAWEGLHVVDVTDPTSPILLATLRVPGWPWRVSACGQLATVFSSTTISSMQLVDLENPEEPRNIGSYPYVGDSAITPGAILGLGNHERPDIFFTLPLPCGVGPIITPDPPWQDSAEVVSVDPATPSLPTLAPARPNPFNPRTTLQFTLPAAGKAVLTIHDARGRLVRVLVDEVLPAGPHKCEWNGRDVAGSALPSSTYFCRLETAAGIQSTKLVLLK